VFDKLAAMEIGTEAWQVEQARRSMAMAPPQSAAPITCGELAALLARLQLAETAPGRPGPGRP
jgi:hypothetical protein